MDELEEDLQEAVRYAHNEEAKRLDDAADRHLSQRFLANDGIVLEIPD